MKLLGLLSFVCSIFVAYSLETPPGDSENEITYYMMGGILSGFLFILGIALIWLSIELKKDKKNGTRNILDKNPSGKNKR